MPLFATQNDPPLGPAMTITPSISELESTSKSVFEHIVPSTTKGSTLVDHVITLLENFKFQADKHKKLGYCDYGVAFVSFRVSQMLLDSASELNLPKFESFLIQIREALENQRGNFNIMCACIHQEAKSVADDPLLQRFSKLKGNINGTDVSQYKKSDSISPQCLNQLIRKIPQSILLLDFRSKKEYSYSHINFLNVVNIEPSLVKLLLEKQPNAKDSDLEDCLRSKLEPEKFAMFSNRHKYDIVVIYNLRFGGAASDRFISLEQLLLNGDKDGLAYANPFLKLIDLLMFRTKYLSSALRQYPLYLSGGLHKWYQTFGEGSLTNVVSNDSTLNKLSQKPLDDTQAMKNSIYLRNFSDYLISAHSHSTDYSALIPESEGVKTNSDSVIPVSKKEPTSHKGVDSSPMKLISRPKTVQEVSRKVEKNNVQAGRRQTETSSDDFLKLFATGLTNLGNSCYMNCIIQCLAATPQMTDFFFKKGDKSAEPSYKQHINMNNKLGTKGVITTSYVKLLSNMLNNSGGSFSPNVFKKIMGSLSPGAQFANSDQQDCVEFLNYILDSLHEDLNQRAVKNAEERASIMELSTEQERARELLPIRLASTIEWERYLKLNFSVIVDYFQGQYLSQLKCLVCQLTSTTYNTFSVLSLPIPESDARYPRSVLLSQCLDLFTETELLDDDNKWHCPRCNTFTRLTKKISITRLPKALIIHFKRFGYESSGRFKKLDTFIKYPVNDELDLTSYWPEVGSYTKEDSSTRISVEKERELLATMPVRNQSPPFKYKLYGVVNHFGNLTTGHYTSYVKKEKGWCYFDDAKVTVGCDESSVLTKSAYCLFYQRV